MEKAIKEKKTVTKKSASKTKDKEKKVAVKKVAKTKTEPVNEQADISVPAETVEQPKVMEEVMQINRTPTLSKPAYQWVEYLKRNKMTPEEFLKRYPTNKFRYQIEEIIQFNAQK